MPFILGANSLTGGYTVDNSCRFNIASADSLQRTPSSAGTLTKWTYSTWIKRSTLGGGQQLFSSGPRSGTVEDQLYLLDGNVINWYDGTSATHVRRSSNLFRDVSAWYHFVFVWDTANGTANYRARIYVNGVEIIYGTQTTISLNANSKINSTGQHRIGAVGTVAGEEFGGYMSEINFIDGQALTPTDFGEFDEDSGIWKPIAYAGTYGTNGFYLDFEDSGALGADTSGNANNFTVNNLTAVDQMLDTPTNNFATFNPIHKTGSLPAFSNGNLILSPTVANYQTSFATMGISTGLAYMEMLVIGTSNTGENMGIGNDIEQNNHSNAMNPLANTTGGYAYYPFNGNKITNNTNSAYGSSLANGDILQIALNMDTGKVWFGKNGVYQASGNPSADTGEAFSGLVGTFIAGMTLYSGGYTSVIVNFGQDSSFAGNKTRQSNQDSNNIGNFYYAPPTGFLALCTKNLATNG